MHPSDDFYARHELNLTYRYRHLFAGLHSRTHRGKRAGRRWGSGGDEDGREGTKGKEWKGRGNGERDVRDGMGFRPLLDNFHKWIHCGMKVY